ncbi:uncharacterized serine-rich protein C215.13-like [Sinocyclocheilus anshuiensis]|uniref:uncharacterized serine-rich protein C215.13-like n=1 Tax=Sinocyclocheilus anshuiensis TaxID=1608454 RepID=UPI0007B7D05F|nr:PREDICTED: uncharacterized serine-rich protein C215.13-like [Sinocyclocheilus anshuiensis]
MSETESQSSTTQSTNPVRVSSSTSSDQTSSTAKSVTSVTGASATTIQNTTSNSATVASTDITSMDTVSANTSSSENYTALSCPAFDCMKDCYVQFMNTTAKPCQSSEYFCKITQQDTGYSVSCSASCGVSCGNGTVSNCSVNCCNTTNCLNNTLLAMSDSLSTTVSTTKSTTTTTTIKATATTTPANNGKKCNTFDCNGAQCYKTSNLGSNVMLCPVGRDYCKLQKTTSGSTESWQAGCSTDCRKMTVCSSTTTTCHLECCNATTTSCLKLSGVVNMPSSATRGPHCPALLMASLLLFWIVKVFP